MANVKLVVNPIAVANHVVITVEMVDALGAEVTRQAFAPPHSQRNLTFAGLDPVMYRFFFWESADGVSLDTLIGSVDIDASLAFDFIITVYEFNVGGPGANDPAAGQPTYANADLAGAVHLVPGLVPAGPAYTVFQRGIGFKMSDEISNEVAGGFSLLLGDAFNDGDKWMVFKYSRVIAPATAITATWPADIITINDNVTAVTVDDHFNRELEMVNELDVQELTFPDLATVANKKYMVINTHLFLGKYVYLNFLAGGGIYFEGQLHDELWIAAGDCISFQVKGGQARLINGGRLGQRGIPQFDVKLRQGYALADGTLYTKAQAPGLYKFVESLAGDYAPASFADWGTASVDDHGRQVYLHKGRYAIDAPSLSIRVPDLRKGFMRGLALGADAERPVNFPGGGQQERVGKFKGSLTLKKGWSYTGAPNNATHFGNGDPNHENDVTINEITVQPKTAADANTIGTRSFNYGYVPVIPL